MKEEGFFSIVPQLCMSLGIQKSSTTAEGKRVFSHMPISYYPYMLSENTFLRLSRLHQIWQKLIVQVASDHLLLEKVSEKMCKNDDFMKRLWNLYCQTKSKNIKNIRIACTRIDYMGDENPKLVEYNLMSVGLNGNSDKVQELGNIINTINDQHTYYPECQNQVNICNQLLLAMEKNQCFNGIVVMVVHQPEFNFGDQNFFKLGMIKLGKIVISLTMEQLIQDMVFDEENNVCYYGNSKISAFYFRTGYSPIHFPSEKHWQLRSIIERSKAVKLPSVDMLIVNSKRMQAQLAKKQILQKYLNLEEVQALLDVCGQIYDFDDLESKKLIGLEEKVKNENYVLKPNREGGGNNYFANKAYEKFIELQKNPQQLQNYIIMKAIQPQKKKNIFIFDFKKEEIPESTAEYSTFGCFLYQGKTIIENKYGGFLVRLKKAQEEQGGIAINKAVLASLCVRKQI